MNFLPGGAVLCLALLQGGGEFVEHLRAQRDSPLENGDVRVLELPAAPELRVEHFRLDLPRTRRAARDCLPSAWRAGSPRRRRTGSLLLEYEISFFDIETKVLLAERLHRDEIKLVWREVRQRGGRTVLLEWSAEDPVLRASDTWGGEVRRKVLEHPSGLLMPLYLLDQVRRGGRFEGPVAVFDPRTGGVEEVVLKIGPPPARTHARVQGDEPSALRCVEQRRRDGVLVARHVFRNDALVAFQWQEGGPLATRVSAADYGEIVRAEQLARQRRAEQAEQEARQKPR